ncbi:hypothetical protein [Vibrio barjaei]|uniref:hypothetical protein n=1 Tax=Vibrio barjaei TaxID=1676683 RepID=UPI002284B89E|nr:hypothetical protein [Vibrio barjaei]MCY9874019.1 hypothetical protein [Vibrio barjaei]
MKTKITLVAALLAATSFTTSAASLKIGTGGEGNNYHGMGLDIASYCEEDVNRELEIIETLGSTQNLVGLLNKQFSVAMVQEDVLNFYAKRDPNKVNKNLLKVITDLHEEAVHLLIPKGYQPKSKEEKGMWSNFFGKDDNQPKQFELSMLKGQTVGSWGGSIVSAEALGYFFGLGLRVVEVKDNVDNTSKPLILVGGAPYKTAQKYLASGKWTLAPLNYDAISQQASFYTKQTVNYQIGGKVRSIPTVGVRAQLIGKSFRKKSRNTPMTELATCIYANVADLADDYETNPNWSSVYDHVETGAQSNWSYFPLDEKKLAEYEEAY